MPVYLRCGKSDAGRGIHGLGHVGGKLADLRIHLGDRGSLPVQPRVGVTQYLQ